MNKFYFSVDVGGTYIKAGAIDTLGNIICSGSVKTETALSEGSLAKSIFDLMQRILTSHGLSEADVIGIGIGLPGLVDSKNGILKFSGNLALKDYPLVAELKKFTKHKIKIANDGDVAALAELKLGAGKDFDNFIMLVIGTGVGGGIVVNKKLLPYDYTGEIGHMKVGQTRLKCTCGSVGCLETIASTSALVRQTKEAMRKNPNSKMWSAYDLETVNGKTPFEFSDDETAKEVLDNFIANLGDGIVNLVNLLRPDAIILGGAISNQQRKLIDPLEKYVNEHIFLRFADLKISILPAKFTGNAGIVGARFLFKEED